MSPQPRVPAVTPPLTGWPPPAAAAAAPPSCAAAGPGTVKGLEPPACSPTALRPPPSPQLGPQRPAWVGDTQDRAEAAGAGSWSNPTGKDTVSSRALAITRFSIICRCRDSVCGAGGALGTSTHTPWPPVGSGGYPRDPLPAWLLAPSGSQPLPSPPLARDVFCTAWLGFSRATRAS